MGLHYGLGYYYWHTVYVLHILPIKMYYCTMMMTVNQTETPVIMGCQSPKVLVVLDGTV